MKKKKRALSALRNSIKERILKTKYAWKHIHQPYELEYHKEKGISDFRIDDEKFWGRYAASLFEDFLNLDKESFQQSDFLIDVGCGPRPALVYFSKGIRVHIDPLLNEYVKLCKEMKITWWDSLGPNDMSFSKPAEELIDSLVGKGRFILCFNVLQHVYNWKKIVENIIKYAHSDSIICVSTKFETQYIGHAANISERDFMNKINKSFEIIDARRDFLWKQYLTLKLSPIIKK